MGSNLEFLKSVLQDWNKNVYGNIVVRKKELIRELEHIQRILEFRSSLQLCSRETEIWKEIDIVLKHEEVLWFQKFRSVWLTNGDRNTKYFHSRTRGRRKANRIEGLIIGDEGWCFDDDKIKQHAVSFFKTFIRLVLGMQDPFLVTICFFLFLWMTENFYQ